MIASLALWIKNICSHFAKYFRVQIRNADELSGIAVRSIIIPEFAEKEFGSIVSATKSQINGLDLS